MLNALAYVLTTLAAAPGLVRVRVYSELYSMFFTSTKAS